jgi:RNA polymerase sigma-70 factor, ECF subfamily
VAWLSEASGAAVTGGRFRADGAGSDQDAFQEFYRANYWKITGIVTAVLGSRAEAEDVTQEAFARALARWPGISGYDLPDAWVRRVALRLAVDSTRRVRRAARLAERIAANPPGAADDPLDPLPSTHLTAALLRVPLRQREVLVLHYLADLPVEVIARDRGLSSGTVKTRLAAGRRRLEQELSKGAEVRDA